MRVAATEPDLLPSNEGLRRRASRSWQADRSMPRRCTAATNLSGRGTRLPSSMRRSLRMSTDRAEGAGMLAALPGRVPRFQTRMLGDGIGSGAPLLNGWPLRTVLVQVLAYTPTRLLSALESG